MLPGGRGFLTGAHRPQGRLPFDGDGNAIAEGKFRHAVVQFLFFGGLGGGLLGANGGRQAWNADRGKAGGGLRPANVGKKGEKDPESDGGWAKTCRYCGRCET